MFKRTVFTLTMCACTVFPLTACSAGQPSPSNVVSNGTGVSSPTNVTRSSSEQNDVGVQPGTTAQLPMPAHVVVVIEENHSYQDIAHNPNAPYLNWLMGNGANFTDYHAVTHPSEPNYLAIFSGSTQALTNDSCPHTFATANLGSELIHKGLSFAGYSEDLPKAGYLGCTARQPFHLSASYARKHVPWVNFTNIPAAASQPWSTFPKDFRKLPTVSFVIPNLNHDMHNGTIKEGDTWLHNNLSAYATWAKTHNSLLIVVWDEAEGKGSNQVPAVFYGDHVRPGNYQEAFTHYSLLRTLETLYALPGLGHSASAKAMTVALTSQS